MNKTIILSNNSLLIQLCSTNKYVTFLFQEIFKNFVLKLEKIIEYAKLK